MNRSEHPYTPVHCRSYYSLLNGLLSPEDICRISSGMGCSAVGIADINNFYGLIRFASAAVEYGLKPLYGTALYAGNRYILSLLCLDREGFSRANRILGRLSDDPENLYDPVEDLLSGGWAGLAVVSTEKEVLKKLARRQKGNLFAGLFYGRPFAGLYRWASAEGIRTMALNDAVYSGPPERDYFRIVRAIALNTSVDRLDPGETLNKAMSFAGPEEMQTFFSAVPDALANAEAYAAEAEGFRFPDSYIFPSFNGMSSRAASGELKRLCEKGLLRRYGGPGGASAGIRSRLEYELGIIFEKGFSGYFLVVHDIVSRFPRTCGRGSAAASLVSYLLGITHVDPVKYNLFFERFLNSERRDPPDIDVDFPWDEREKALDYAFARYAGSVGMVADHVTFGMRSAFREPARVLGMSSPDMDRMSGLWRNGKTDEIPVILQRAASGLYGIPRHIGTHPGGIVITPGPVTDYTHIHKSPMGRPVIAWEKDAAEDAGLVKIDFLGNRSLGVLRDCIAEVNSLKEAGGNLEWDSFSPENDSETVLQIEGGDTLGVFYIESPATRQLLRKMNRGNYESLIIASSIIRPAANRYINEFVRRLHGGTYERLPEPVGSLLEETMGIMVYQEDVSRVAIAAGFSVYQADMLRKVLARKDREKRLIAFESEFRRKAAARGMTASTVDELWRAILSFDGYSFSKAHSASYALVSCKLAWMKRHYPLVFYTSVINNGGGYYTRQVYLNEVVREGFRIEGPDVNVSGLKYRAEGSTMFMGLLQLKGISESLLEKIVDERRSGGEFTGYEEFLKRVRPDFGSLRILVKSGSLDSISGGLTRPQMIWVYYHRERLGDLLGGPCTPDFIKDYSAIMKIRDEVITTGLVISRHPLMVFRRRIEAAVKSGRYNNFIDSRGMEENVGRKVVIPGFHTAEKEVRTKNNRAMSFVSFEDQFGLFETVIFPDVYQKIRQILEDGVVFLISGMVENESGALQISVENLYPLYRTGNKHVRSPFMVISGT